MPSTFPSPEAFAAYLDSLNFFHMDLSLGRMQATLRAMDLERPPFAVVQVVGTNGKGSTASFLASLLESHGLRTGLYTSPHFHTPAERIQIDGRWTAMEDWLESAARAVDLCPQLTYFELLTVIALDVFRKAKVDCAILEAGLGARYDATTATAADLVVYAPIALDHTAILGRTVEAIAQEKAHAIRSKAPVVTAPQSDDALRCLKARAGGWQAPLFQAAPLAGGTNLGLAGSHQLVNAGTALEAFTRLAGLLGITVDGEKCARGLARAFFPGRLQRVAQALPGKDRPARPACLLDGAHNPHGMHSLVDALERGEVPMPQAVVFSCLADKDWRSALALLTGTLAAHAPGIRWLVPQLPGERAEQPQTIAQELALLGQHNVTPLPACRDCFAELAESGCEGPVLVTGSLYLLAEFYDLWPETLTRESAGTAD